MLRAAATCVLVTAVAGCDLLGVLQPPDGCDLEVTVDDREFDVECDYDDDEGEYSCTCEGAQLPLSQEPPSCDEQCAGETCGCAADDVECLDECTGSCLEGCDDGADGIDGPLFSEDFEDDAFCTLADDAQQEAAIAACNLD